MTKRDSSAEIDDVAALWVARAEARALSPDQQMELDRWLAADVRRQGAFARARAISIYVARVQAGKRNFPAIEDET